MRWSTAGFARQALTLPPLDRARGMVCAVLGTHSVSPPNTYRDAYFGSAVVSCVVVKATHRNGRHAISDAPVADADA